jgi:hypothetical protein
MTFLSVVRGLREQPRAGGLSVDAVAITETAAVEEKQKSRAHA